jgi:hypothetical protein
MQFTTTKPAKERHCLFCSGSLRLFRRLGRKSFCSDEHERKYLAELGKIAMVRLQTAGIRLESLRCRGACA